MTQDPAEAVYELVSQFWPRARTSKDKVSAIYHARLKGSGPIEIADAMRSVMLEDPDATGPHWKLIFTRLSGGSSGSHGCEFDAFVKSLRNDKTSQVSDEGVVRGWLMSGSPLFKWQPERQAFTWLGPTARICKMSHPVQDECGKWIKGSTPCGESWNVCHNRRMVETFVSEWREYFKFKDEPEWLSGLASGDRRIG